MSKSISYDAAYEKITALIMQQCDLGDLNIDKIQPDHILNVDLGLDSVDFLNLIFDIESEFEIKIPSEEWMNRASEQASNAEDSVFRLSNFVENVLELVEEQRAVPA
jgi:acyl carrier protein